MTVPQTRREARAAEAAVEQPASPGALSTDTGSTAVARGSSVLFGRGLLYVVVWSMQLVVSSLISPVLAHLMPPAEFGVLASAIALTRDGGVVLYATCSPHLAETVGVVADALRRQPVEALDTRPLFDAGPTPMTGLGAGPHVQLWPHRHGTDAMFAAALRVRR